MRLATVVGMCVATTALWACGEEGAKPIVDESISWVLNCENNTCGTFFQDHSQAADPETPFEVLSCKRDTLGFQVQIRDPGNEDRPPSTLSVFNANLAGTCRVTVVGAQSRGTPQFTMVGNCGTECTFTGNLNHGDWDFDGSLICSGLSPQAGSGTNEQQQYALYAAGRPGVPVSIKVDNCSL